MGEHRIRTCDLGDCFGNKNYRCKVLDVSIYDDCPFYKPTDMDMERYADIKVYRYAVARIASLHKTMEESQATYRKARAEYEQARVKLDEARRWKNRLKAKIKGRMKLDKN